MFKSPALETVLLRNNINSQVLGYIINFQDSNLGRLGRKKRAPKYTKSCRGQCYFKVGIQDSSKVQGPAQVCELNLPVDMEHHDLGAYPHISPKVPR